MMHWLLVAMVVASLTTMFVWATPSEADEPGNLVPNPGFEADSDGDGIPDGWELSVASDDYRFSGELCDRSLSGRRAFCAEGGLGRRGTRLSSDSFDLKPNAAYEISVWMRMDSPFPKDVVGLRVGTDGGSESFDLQVTREWTRQKVTLFTEPGTSSGSLRFSELGGLADRVYIDDVAMVETDATDDRPPIHRTDLSVFEFPEHRYRVEHSEEEIKVIRASLAGKDITEHRWVQDAEPWLTRQLHFFE
ncbi:MAG: hypothetical protein QGI83_22635, partial [Candidatus Latescibacteria bacterium]|nr:hypothetical protein [Candidatus Latescibacterota bacterium]